MTLPSDKPGLPGLAPAQPAGPAFDPVTLFQDAVRAHDAGRLEEAERGYRLALGMEPANAPILAYLGVLLLERGLWEEGAQVLEQSLAIDPRQADMLTNHGNAMVELGRFEEAVTSYEAAIALQPPLERAGAYNDLGAYMHGLGRHTEALAAYAKAIAIKPGLAEAWANRGTTRLSQQRPLEALVDFDRAIALKPDFAEALSQRGVALYQAERPTEALAAFDKSLAAYDKALAADPQLGGVHNNKGLAYQNLDMLDEALACADRAVALSPDLAENYNNRGMVHVSMGRPEAALADYDRAIALDPNYAGPRWNKSLVLLMTGDYAGGWPLYEWRWKQPDALPDATFDSPLWLGGEPIGGKTLLLRGEQGFGDTLQMLRYAPLLAERGAKVIVSVPDPLIPLARSIAGIEAAPPGPLPTFDLHCPMMSLPLAVGTRLDTVPNKVPYLAVPAEKAAEWQARLGPKTRRRIGLAWSGNPGHKNDRNRGIALAKLLPLLDADADFHSLQMEYREADALLFVEDGRMHEHGDDIRDFADTAALIEQMDLVISVDTAVAHLTGALGRPFYLLLPRIPDYRWGLTGETTPWYPTARLFRQTEAGDWSGVIAAVAEALDHDDFGPVQNHKT